MNDASRIFTKIYEEKGWKADSVSGPGSNLAITKLLRPALQKFFADYEIKSLCDAPCGDANWIAEITGDLDLYLGFDIVEPLILDNLRRHKRVNHLFQVANIIEDVLPRADAILCRDCLVHLPLASAQRAIANFKTSGATYLIATTFHERTENPEKRMGGWRPLNMQLAPFDFPEPLLLINELNSPDYRYRDKSIGVWKLAAIQ